MLVAYGENQNGVRRALAVHASAGQAVISCQPFLARITANHYVEKVSTHFDMSPDTLQEYDPAVTEIVIQMFDC